LGSIPKERCFDGQPTQTSSSTVFGLRPDSGSPSRRKRRFEPARDSETRTGWQRPNRPAPVISGREASGLFDPVSGPNALFRVNSGFNDIADNMTKLQSGQTSAHVRIGLFSTAVGSSATAFGADEPGTGYAGRRRPQAKGVAGDFAGGRRQCLRN